MTSSSFKDNNTKETDILLKRSGGIHITEHKLDKGLKVVLTEDYSIP